MISKFQNRLVGTIILIVIGMIILPNVLDNEKKYHKKESVKIQLTPMLGNNQQNNTRVSLSTKTLPIQSFEITNTIKENTSSLSSEEKELSVLKQNSKPTIVISSPNIEQPQSYDLGSQKEEEPVKLKSIKQSRLIKKSKIVERTKSEEQIAPLRKEYVVQLAALKNLEKVNEIVAQLRLSGYHTWIVPSTPVQGQITRIYIGPDVSKEKMQVAVCDLKIISGLSGIIKIYTGG